MFADYYGLPVGTIANEHLRVDYLATAGPRIVRLMLACSDENLLAEVPGQQWETPFGVYRTYGGHRLWHAPEAAPRSSVPDAGPLTVEPVPGGVRLTAPVEPFTGIRKTVEIRLDPGKAGLALRHVLTNEGAWPVELAAWAITQLPAGGAAVVPQGRAGAGAGGLLPDRQLVLWPYTSLGDPRLDLQCNDYLVVRTEPPDGPCKIGTFNATGWLAYRRADTVFVKRFTPQPGRPHADMGCNAEIHVQHAVIELETLSPLTRLDPGGNVEHEETWEIYNHPDYLPAGLRLPPLLG